MQKVLLALLVLFLLPIPALALADSGWKLSLAYEQGWNESNFNDSGWSAAVLPYSQTDGKPVYFRRLITIAADEMVTMDMFNPQVENSLTEYADGYPWHLRIIRSETGYAPPPLTCWLNGQQRPLLSVDGDSHVSLALTPGKNLLACRAEPFTYNYFRKPAYPWSSCFYLCTSWSQQRTVFDLHSKLTNYPADSVHYLCDSERSCKIGGPYFDSACEAACFPWGGLEEYRYRYCGTETINSCLFAWNNPSVRNYFWADSSPRFLKIHSTEPVNCSLNGKPVELKNYGEPYWEKWAVLDGTPDSVNNVDCTIAHRWGDGSHKEYWNGKWWESRWTPAYHEFEVRVVQSAPVDIATAFAGESGGKVLVGINLTNPVSSARKLLISAELWANSSSGKQQVDAVEKSVDMENSKALQFSLDTLPWRDQNNYTFIVTAVDSGNSLTFQKQVPIELSENKPPELASIKIGNSTCALTKQECKSSCSEQSNESWKCPTGRIICSLVNWWNPGKCYGLYDVSGCEIFYDPNKYWWAQPTRLWPGNTAELEAAGCKPRMSTACSSNTFCQDFSVEWKTCAQPHCTATANECAYTAECEGSGALEVI